MGCCESVFDQQVISEVKRAVPDLILRQGIGAAACASYTSLHDVKAYINGRCGRQFIRVERGCQQFLRVSTRTRFNESSGMKARLRRCIPAREPLDPGVIAVFLRKNVRNILLADSAAMDPYLSGGSPVNIRFMGTLAQPFEVF